MGKGSSKYSKHADRSMTAQEKYARDKREYKAGRSKFNPDDYVSIFGVEGYYGTGKPSFDIDEVEALMNKLHGT